MEVIVTEERKGQIALLLVRDRFRNDGVRLKPDMRRDIGNTAKKIGVPVDELVEFVGGITREMVDEVFPSTSSNRINPDHNSEM